MRDSPGSPQIPVGARGIAHFTGIPAHYVNHHPLPHINRKKSNLIQIHFPSELISFTQMLFTSLAWLIFLPLVFTGWRLIPARWKMHWLLAASYFFYMYGEWWFGGLLLLTTVVDWYAALRIEAAATLRTRKSWLLASVLSNIGVLAAFKYSAFFWNTGVWLGGGQSTDFIAAIAVPAGLSFYTFQSMSYTIDVYRKQTTAEKSVFQFALFVSFFPQLVAGPVERYSHLNQQLKQPKPPDTSALGHAGRLMLWGFFKKIAIADRLATYVDPLFATPENFGALTLLLGGFLFAVQVYCDFSGYTDIATGTARLFGVELMLNWKRPLLSRSLHEFWQRNHISMTTWFRDYVFIPLGGSRTHAWRVQVNLLLTFLISGLWHGASWAFVIWGALHGFAYLIERVVMKRLHTSSHAWLRLPGWVWLIVFHSVSIIAFRAGNLDVLQSYVGRMVSASWSFWGAVRELRALHDLFPLLVAGGMIVLLFGKELAEERGWLRHRRDFTTVLRPVFYVILFVVLFLVGEFGVRPFIYFSF